MSTENTTTPVDLKALTPEQKKALKLELEAEQKADKDRIYNERQQYKQLVDATVNEVFAPLQSASDALSDVKDYVFNEFKSLIKMKAELYDRETDQFTHTFSSEDGSISITIGCNVTDSWDDTVDTGVSKVNDYLQTLVHDEASKQLVAFVTKLLSKNSKGALKASRVLQLKNLAEKSGNKDFIDAIEIIQQAYKPTRSKEFIRCEYKNDNGQKITLPLSISEANFPAKEDPENGAIITMTDGSETPAA
jgi:Protein of unknown function (DUF3164)